jgi:pimeloyl-ACP methyl ester carboxylesterase
MPETSVRERTVTTGEVELRVSEAGDGPVVLLAHGFPELGFSWRRQLPALAGAGYRAVAPDQRGYGRSSRPDDVEAYDIHHLTDDLVGLLDDLGQERAVVVGHDWGSMVASHLALLHPDRVAALVNMSVPHLPRGPVAPITALRAALGDGFFYILYFQEPGLADAELGGDPERTMRRMLAAPSRPPATMMDASTFAADGRGFVDRLPEPDGLPAWLEPEALQHYVDEFARTGFTGGINWYRNMDRNWETTASLDGAVVRCPSLFVGGAYDPVLAMMPPSIGHAALGDHRGDVVIDGAGHWVQQEAAPAVNAALLDFLAHIQL